MKFQIYVRFLCLFSVCVSDAVTSVLSDKHAVEEGKILLKETRKFTNKELDLVFVLDRSKSITTSGWQNVLIFLHSFLEHFTVNSDNTRIAVISFGTNATIEINDLKSGNENKCSIISKFRKYVRIKIPYGYTATYNALITARQIILADSRPSAKKVVIVVTDGRSNLGPPPIRASVEMRSLKWSKWDEQKDGPQLEIFSFGVHQTDLIELKSISSPLPNHTFHIDSFSQFYDIAKSLHNDEQEESWDVMDKNECTSTCHDNAVCMCGSKSGQYLCVCLPGYQGTDDDCKPCDRGYYKDSTLPFPCKPCPENMTTESIGSTDRSSCVCKLGFYKDGDDCTYRVCSESPEIANGYKFNLNGMVHDEVSPTGQACLNKPGTSCHYKCNIGYRLTGDPGLICQANGIWKGSVPECEIVDCGDLKYHNEVVEHGTVQYINTTTTFQSVLSTSCNKGWILYGDSTRTCTRFGVWSGTKATCVESRCQPLRITEGIELFPLNCSSELQYPGEVCRYRCKRGYDMTGPDRAVCDDTGSWMGSTVTKCTDVEAPRIICPEDLTVPLTTSHIAIVYWNSQKPISDDNSGETRLRITGLESHPANLTIGYYTVRYVVEDKEGNSDSCTRNIQVVDKMINLVYCPRNITNRSVSGNSLRVHWQKPVFIDTYGKQVDYQCSRINGSVFQLGSYNIHCAVLATEAVHNAPSCTFSISLERKQCKIPPAPYHGSLSCNTGSNDALMICTVKCNSGYDFYYTPQTHYKCDLSGNWILKTSEQFWPDCSRKYHPRRAKMRGLAEFFYYNGNCEENKRIILDKFTSLVQRLSWEICGQSSCTVSNVTVKCGIQSRRRREAYKSKDFPGPMNDDKTNLGAFDVFSIKSLDVGIEENIEISTEAPVIIESPSSGVEHTMSVLTSTTESLQSTSTIPTDEEITYDDGDRTTTVEFMTTYRDISESSKSVTEDSPKSLSTTNAYSSDPTLEDTSLESMTEPTHTSLDFTDHEEYTEEPNVTVDATKHPDKQNGSLMIDFLIENETNKTNVTQMDLEEVLDALWKVFDEILLSNISIKQAEEDMILTPRDLDFNDPSVVSCHVGYIPILDIVEQCVACPRGTKFLNASCEPCAIGFYQNETAQIECNKCPYGHTTIENGAVSFDNCTEPCPQGSASSTGYKPCTLCDVSTYQDETEQTQCKVCPNNTVTLGVGSTTFNDCIDPSLKISCLEGSNSSFCPRCNDSVCLNGGQCVAVGQDILCNCPIGYSGVRCEVPYDLCQPNPCFNNGSCFQDDGGYSCACRDYFDGDQCETYISPCEKMTCLNGGSCLDEGYGIFKCYCLHNFTGEMCDVKLDHCISNSCLNGTCINEAYGYVCDCVSGYAGRHCDTAINYSCRNLDCQNNGRCIEDVQGPSCSCLSGYSGIRCEFNDDDCSSSLCKNNATCVDGNGEYMCRCIPGFSGQHCEEVAPKNFDLQLDNNLGIGYVRYHPVHDSKITDLTISLWFRSYQKNIGVLLSYTDNEVYEDFVEVISVEEKKKLLTFSVMNSKVTTPIDLRPGYWHYVILDWSSKYGIWHVYVNGTLSANGFKLAQGMSLSYGGSLTLGLKENYYGGTRNIWTAFTGEINQFNMYDYIIPEDIIRTKYTNNSCNTELGNLIAWSDSLKGLHGTVTVRNQSRCLDINECVCVEGQRCTENNQICKDKPGGYECVCAPGFTGNNCVDSLDECLHINCFNGGYCEDSHGSLDAICICPKGFSGKFCEIKEGWVCSNLTCINGICVANECKCDHNWRGGNCDVLYKSGCELSPCLSNSTCIPDVFSIEGFRCKCPKSNMPYDKNCKPLPCVFSPCLNNGICYDNYDASFNCECVEGFSGTYCEIAEEKENKSISGCKSNPCNSNGICIDNNGNVYCKCDDGHTGKWCENSLRISSTEGLGAEEEIIVIYTCLSILIVIITATCFLILCYFIKKRRTYPTKHRRLLPVLNNESIGMSILHNPVFTMDDGDDDDKDDDGRQRSASGTYENPYAEPGDIPYIDDFIDVKNNKSKVKQCNIQRAASHNNSKSSYTSNRSSAKSLKKLDGAYLQPIFTKNQLDNLGTSEKNKKALLPASQKSFKGKSDIDNVLPNPPEYENQPTDKDPIVTKSIPLLLSEDYVNEPSDKRNDPCIRLQNIIDSKPNPKPNISKRSVTGENIVIVNPTSPTASEDSRTYLHVVEPKPGEFPPHKSKHFEVAPCNRKLPPIPKEKF